MITLCHMGYYSVLSYVHGEGGLVTTAFTHVFSFATDALDTHKNCLIPRFQGVLFCVFERDVLGEKSFRTAQERGCTVPGF